METIVKSFPTGKKRWSGEDIRILMGLRQRNKDWNEISFRLGRTIEACKSRVWRETHTKPIKSRGCMPGLKSGELDPYFDDETSSEEYPTLKKKSHHTSLYDSSEEPSQPTSGRLISSFFGDDEFENER
eukprot:UN33882